MNEQQAKALGSVIIILFSIIGLALVLGMIITWTNPMTVFSRDYINKSKSDLDIKIGSMKDSAMSHITEPKIYNRYVDSVNKYSYIYNYLNQK